MKPSQPPTVTGAVLLVRTRQMRRLDNAPWSSSGGEEDKRGADVVCFMRIRTETEAAARR